MATLTYLSIIWGSFLSWHTVKYLRLYLLIISFAKDFILSWFYSWKSKIFWDIAVLVFWKSCKHWGKIDKLFQSGPMLLVDQNISNLAHFKEKCVKKYHFRVVSLSDQKLGHYNYKFSPFNCYKNAKVRILLKIHFDDISSSNWPTEP